LVQGQEKMSKSDPNSAIFMEDSEVEVNTKIKKAFCPPQVCRLQDAAVMDAYHSPVAT
jgi:tryptophanyl-tRNA synthetase